MKNRFSFCLAHFGGGIEKSVQQPVVAGPEFFDREIGPEKTAANAENLDGLGYHPGDVFGIIAMNERTECR